MTYLITHYFEGGTQEQYDAIVAEAHPADGSLPVGQLHHFAGPTDGGFLVVALWETKEQNDEFQQTLFPIIGALENPPPPPEERTAQVTNQVSA
jgi:hypothetical protein